MVEITPMNHIANLAAVPSLVRAALLRSLRRLVAVVRLASRLAAVVVLATYQRAAVTAWRWHRVASSNVGKDSTRSAWEGRGVSVERKARAA